MSVPTEDEEYRSSDDEDYVPEDAGDDVDEPSGDECEEVGPDGASGISGKRLSAAKSRKPVDDHTSSSTAQLTDAQKQSVDDVFRELIGMDAMEEPPLLPSTSSASADVNKDKKEKGPSETATTSSASKKDEGKTTVITEVFDFAGDEIRVNREVSEGEALAHATREQQRVEAAKNPQKRAGLTGALKLLQKRPKMSVLDKSNLDWAAFKTEEKIDDDLAVHNRGRGGFLAKQEFLSKADHAQFEREKQMRALGRKQ